MAHYAFLDKNNIVTEVIVGKNEGEEDIDWEDHYGNFRGQVCKSTSYNTHQGKYWGHNHVSHEQSKAFRKNFAGIGYLYDEQRDAFIPPKPYSSWILNEDSCTWEPPIPQPPTCVNGVNRRVEWNEETQSWDIS